MDEKKHEHPEHQDTWLTWLIALKERENFHLKSHTPLKPLAWILHVTSVDGAQAILEAVSLLGMCRLESAMAGECLLVLVARVEEAADGATLAAANVASAVAALELTSLVLVCTAIRETLETWLVDVLPATLPVFSEDTGVTELGCVEIAFWGTVIGLAGAPASVLRSGMVGLGAVPVSTASARRLESSTPAIWAIELAKPQDPFHLQGHGDLLSIPRWFPETVDFVPSQQVPAAG